MCKIGRVVFVQAPDPADARSERRPRGSLQTAQRAAASPRLALARPPPPPPPTP